MKTIICFDCQAEIEPEMIKISEKDNVEKWKCPACGKEILIWQRLERCVGCG